MGQGGRKLIPQREPVREHGPMREREPLQERELMRERELIREAQKGDREAFLKLIEPYHERVYATAMRLLGNSEDASEITQEALLRTFWKIQTFHGKAHFYTWLYRIALNLCYRRMTDSHARIADRALSVDAPLESSDESAPAISVASTDPSPADTTIREEEVAMVRQALGTLRPADFQILVLREFEGLSYDEIAQRLRLSRGTVMSRLHRARLALAHRLRELGLP